MMAHDLIARKKDNKGTREEYIEDRYHLESLTKWSTGTEGSLYVRDNLGGNLGRIRLTIYNPCTERVGRSLKLRG